MDEKKLEEIVQTGFEQLKKNIQEREKEYKALYQSMVDYLRSAKPEAHIIPREYKYFFNWWAYEKHGDKGPGELFSTRIIESDFIEYSKFKKHIIKSGEIPFWYDWEDDEFWIKPHTKITRREALAELRKEKNGVVNRPQLITRAKKLGFDPESFADFHQRIYGDTR